MRSLDTGLHPNIRKQSPILLLFLFLSACSLDKLGIVGDGNVIEKERTSKTFNSIKNKDIVDVDLVSGSGPLTVRADSNIIPHVKTKVKNKTLHLDLKERVRKFKTLKVVVPVEEEQLDRIRNKGTGDIHGQFPLKGDKITLKNSGTGDLDLNLQHDRIEYEGSGTGDVSFEGESSHFEVENSGTGDVEAFGLEAGTVKCRSSGTGDIEITATQELYVDMSGTGDVLYKGGPELKEVSIDGTGDLTKVD